MSNETSLPFSYPLDVMLAKARTGIPEGEGYLFEPKWDGFRTLVSKDGDDVYLQSRERKPMLRYFPELRAPIVAQLPERCVLDGELVIVQDDHLDFEALQMRIHPAKSRVEMLAKKTPARFVAFDLLALGNDDLRDEAFSARRAHLESTLAGCTMPLHVTPCTDERARAQMWFERFEGAGLDGVIAKPIGDPYQSKKRAMLKIKHRRTADCAVAGFRWYKKGPGELVGSLLLGLHDDEGKLHHVGITSSFTMQKRAELKAFLEPHRLAEGDADFDAHPWADWARADAQKAAQRKPGMQSRWSGGKDLSWQPLRIGLVAEVRYDQLQSGRFRHATTFVRWRDDREPQSCRYDQLETADPFLLREIFARDVG